MQVEGATLTGENMIDVHQLDGINSPYELRLDMLTEDPMYGLLTMLREVNPAGVALSVSQFYIRDSETGEIGAIPMSELAEELPSVEIGVPIIFVLPDAGTQEIRVVVEFGYEGEISVEERLHEDMEQYH